MKIYRIAGESDQGTNLFDYCVKMSENFTENFDEWMRRAEQVANGKVVDISFAIWLRRRADDDKFGDLANKMASEYFRDNS